jgi:DNA-binding response OmpR family regulator
VHPSPSVLIVDRSEENREVLTTALQRKGIRTYSAARAGRGAELAQSLHPDLIVLDLELDHNSPEKLCSRFAASGAKKAPIVLLGNLHRGAAPPAEEIVGKPYHYGPLVRRIEEILAAGAQQVAESA